MLTVGSCFAGVGGFDLGLEATGQFRTVWYSEVNPAAVRVMCARFPDAQPLGDITTLFDGLFWEPGPVDVLTGGPPCQDISKGNAYGRRGLAGARSVLFHTWADLVRTLEPRWVVMEQVLGLLTSNTGADYLTVLTTFSELGYETAAVAHNSRAYVPQSRGRLYVVGCRRPGAAARAVLPLLEDGARHPDAYQPARWARPGDLGAGTRTFRKSHRPRGVDDSESWVPAEYANTLTLYDVGQARATVIVIDDTGRPRVLTPAEWERCHGFPAGWTEPAGDDYARWSVLGNAVSPPVARRLGDGLVTADLEGAA